MNHKIENVKKFYVLKCWMFSFEAEGFSRTVAWPRKRELHGKLPLYS
jgi:hypothetical protein